jgi:hypothetical protein
MQWKLVSQRTNLPIAIELALKTTLKPCYGEGEELLRKAGLLKPLCRHRFPTFQNATSVFSALKPNDTPYTPSLHSRHMSTLHNQSSQSEDQSGAGGWLGSVDLVEWISCCHQGIVDREEQCNLPSSTPDIVR